MGCFKDHRRRNSGIVSLLPAGDAEAPPIPTLKPGEVKLWRWGGEVIAALFSKAKKLLGHHRAYGVATTIALPGLTKSITIESGHRTTTALLEGLTEHVLALRFFFVLHPALLTTKLTLLAHYIRRKAARGNPHHDTLDHKK
jgi:hypothetical protein